MSCQHSRCTSGKPGVWCPVLVMPIRGTTLTARGRLVYRLCDDCRDCLTIGHLLDTPRRLWQNVLAKWPSRWVQPRQEDARLDFDLIDLDEDPAIGVWQWE